MISLSDVNTSGKVLIAAFVIGIGSYLYLSRPHPVVVSTDESLPVVVLPPIAHGSALLPKPDAPIAGVVTVIHSHRVTPRDTVGTIIRDTTFIFTMTDPHLPPLARSDSTTRITFQRVSDPWIQIELGILLGGSASREGVSPYSESSFITLFDEFRLGVGVDEEGVGPALNWEFWREFNVGVTYRLIRFNDVTPWMATFSYRF